MDEIFNLSALCRCCHTDGSYKSLNLYYSYNGQVEKYANMLHETFGLTLHQPSIEASYSICDTCIEKLRKALQFKKQVQECEIKFAEYCNNEMALQTEIKIESELMEQDINNASISPDTLQENESLKENESSSEKKQSDCPKKRKPGRPKTSKSRAEQRRDANRRYKQTHPEVVRKAQKRYAEKHPEVHRAAVKRYRAKHPEVHQAAVKRYATKHPEISRAASKRYAEKRRKAHKAAVKPTKIFHSDKIRKPQVNIKVKECKDNTHDYEHSNAEYADNIEYSGGKKQKSATPCTGIVTERLKKEKTVESHSKIQPKKCLEKQKSNESKNKTKQKNRLEKEKFNIPECNDVTEHSCDHEHSNAEYADNIELSGDDSDKEKKENIEYEQNCLEKQKSATPCTERLKKEKTVETHSIIQPKKCLEKQKSNVSKAKTKQKNRIKEEKFNIPGNLKSDTRIKDDTGAVNTCHNCNSTYKSEIFLRNHLQRKHSIFSCKICKEIFGSKEALAMHKPIHSTIIHECDICGKVFTKKGGLKAHKNQHTRAKIFTCDICNKDFLYKSGLKAHIDFHLGRTKKIMCDLCGHTFNDNMANLKSHIRSVHEKLRPFKCDQCHKTYSTRKILKIHTRGHTGERPYVCQLCNKAFMHTTALRHHNEKIHTDRKLVCNTRSRLAPRKHSGVKSFVECYYCEREFSDKFALKRHIERHNGTAKIFPCKICHKNFATKAVMIRHMKSIHDPNKQFVVKTKCNLCNRTIKDMVKHMKTHTERLFQCKQCSRSYSESSTLKQHVRETHCGITQDCNLCDKKYIKAQSLRIHKLKKT